jgi:uncharacterized protein with GYD domain
MKTIKEGPNRLAKAKELAKAAGGEIKAFYLAMGQYDAVVISEAPSDQAYAASLLTIGSGGAVRTQTLRVFPEDEYKEIIGSLP